MATVSKTTDGERFFAAWRIISPILKKIMSLRGTSMTENMQIHHCIYELCVIPSIMCNARVPLDNAKRLYNALRRFQAKHVARLRRKIARHTGANALSAYEANWSKYVRVMKDIDTKFIPLNRHWIRKNSDEDLGCTTDVYATALVLWRDDLFKSVSEEISRAILDRIEKDRRGGCTRTTQVQVAINSLIHMDDVLTPEDTDISLYRTYLEYPLLNETVKFYEAESRLYLSEHSVADYLKWVEEGEEREKEIADYYFRETTVHQIMRRLYECLVVDRMEAIAGEFKNLMKIGQYEAVTKMWKSLSRFEKGKTLIVSLFESYVLEYGLEALQSVCDDAKSSPKTFVEKMVEILFKCGSMLETVFHKHPSCTKVVVKSCERFVNQNAITEALGNPYATVDLLAKYTDVLLQKNASSSNANPKVDLEEGLSHVMEVFRYIENKDIFVKKYASLLARRLLHKRSISEAAERSMIARLTNFCGQLYTKKLQCMLNEINSGQSFEKRFSEWLKEKREVTENQVNSIPATLKLSVTVLSSKAWPFKSDSDLVLPVELERCTNRFAEFYNSIYQRRKLTWIYHQCHGEIHPLYTKRRYSFSVSTHQISILTLFNKATCYTVSQMKESTNIKEGMLNQILEIFLMAGILVVHTDKETGKQMGQEKQRQQLQQQTSASLSLTPETRLSLCLQYSNNRFRVNLNLPIKSELKREAGKNLKEVEQDRTLTIAACIARIMKARKKMDHTELVEEVMNQIPPQFKIRVAQIKSSIGSLIEDGYIERDPQNMSSYAYIA